MKKMERYPNVAPIVNGRRIDQIPDDQKNKYSKEYLEFASKQIEKQMFYYQGFTKFLIDNYNTFIEKIVNGLLSIVKGKISETESFWFEGISFEPPSIPSNVGKTEPMYPHMARSLFKTYTSRMTGTIVYEKKTPGIASEFERRKNVTICSIPVMLGSAICNLKNKTGKELISFGEEGTDPLGYFIVKGTEKLILGQVRSRLNTQLLYMDTRKGKKDRLINSMTSGGITDSTSLITVSIGDDYTYQVSLGILKTPVNAYVIFKLFQDFLPKEGDHLETRDITNFILSFAQEEDRSKMRLELLNTIATYNAIGEINPYIAEHVVTKTKNAAAINEIIEYQLFPHMADGYAPETLRRRKISLLSMMIMKILQFKIGKRKLDDRDSWICKRIDAAGKSFERLFFREYTNYIKKIEKQFEKKETKVSGAESIIGMFKSGEFSNTLEDAFTPGRWSTKSDAYRTMTDTLSRAGVSTMLSHLTRLTIPSTRKGKTMKSRNVVMSQLGFVCPTESPEGQACGLNLNLACTCVISNDTNPEVVYQNAKDFLTSDRDETHPNQLLVNGSFVGWCNSTSLCEILHEKKLHAVLNPQTGIVIMGDVLWVNTDASRPLRPVLVVENGKLPILEKNMLDAPFNDLLSNGCIEYIEPREQETLYIAESVKYMHSVFEIYKGINEELLSKEQILSSGGNKKELFLANLQGARKKGQDDVEKFISMYLDKYEGEDPSPYDIGKRISQSSATDEDVMKFLSLVPDTDMAILENEVSILRSQRSKAEKYTKFSHCEINPNAMFGIVARLIPMAERSQAARNTYQSGMGKQALSLFSGSRMNRFDNVQKTMMYPQRSFFRTSLEDYIGSDTMPSGQNIIIALTTNYGSNQEDSVVVNKGSVDRGLFRMIIFFSYKNEILPTKGFDGAVEIFTAPPLRKGKKAEVYSYIDENGIPADYDHEFVEGDCIIGKVRYISASKDGSRPMRVEDDSTYIEIGEGGKLEKVLVSLVDGRKVVQVKLRQIRIPQAGDKIASRYAQKATIGRVLATEDMPFFPNSGMVPDIIMNPLSIPSRQTMGQMIEILASKAATMLGERVDASSFGDFDLGRFQHVLTEYGFSCSGEEAMIDGRTGRMMRSTVYTGPCYYQLLRHLVMDKFQMRSTGAVNMLYQQPIQGRARHGALRMGEMERDAMIAHGAPGLLNERLCFSSDKYTIPVCSNCGYFAHSDEEGKMICKRCKAEGKFGKITIPYVFKLLQQYLLAMGISVLFKVKKRNDKIYIEEENTGTESELQPNEAGNIPLENAMELIPEVLEETGGF